MKDKNNQSEHLSVGFTRWIGSVDSLVLHTIIFIGSFALIFFGFAVDTVLLVLTTVVSLEAIYLAIFIQMTVNRSMETIAEVGEDIEEIQEDVGEIQEDVGEIQEDVKGLEEDVEDISEDVDKIQEDDSKDAEDRVMLEKIQGELQKLLADIETLKALQSARIENHKDAVKSE